MKNNQSNVEPPLVLSGDWQELKAVASSIRSEVFVKEQHVPESIEMDDRDKFCTHIVILEKTIPVATGRLDQDGKIGRMAVKSVFRRQNYGTKLLISLVEEAAKIRLDKVYCHAQVQAIGFYEKMGFICQGEIYAEAGIEHQTMSLAISHFRKCNHQTGCAGPPKSAPP